MNEFFGISASPGIVAGKAFLYIDESYSVPRYDIQIEEIEREFERFNEACSKAVTEITDLKSIASDEIAEKESRFLDAHILMLQDPEFSRSIRDNLDQHKLNVEWVVYKTVEDLVSMLSSSKDLYMRERAIDLHDVSRRVINHLMYRESINLADLTEEVILVTHNLLPSDALAMNKRMIKGIAMDAGGKTSHTAILARAFEIPAVLGLSNITGSVRTGDEIILDGHDGKVIVFPDDSTSRKYEDISHERQRREVQLLSLNKLPAETKDGKLLRVMANIEIPEETDSVIAHGADGIGLYRSEFLFLQPGKVFDEDEQYHAYRRVLEAMDDKEVTIRTLDVGGDKALPDVKGFNEKNPILGWRAIRFCLSQKDMFKTQLRALLRASVHGNLRIMFPMISGIEELVKVLELLEEAKDECKKKGQEINENISKGIMIEVPSAALTSDILAKRVDFFSIGTNDLIQYTIAVDRGNEKIAYLYEPFHPAVIRLIKTVIDNAHENSIPVSMCGEMAGDPYAAVVLLGLGLDVFSMSSFSIPEVKQIIRSVSVSDAEDLVGEIFDMRSYKEIDRYIKVWMNERFETIGV